MNTNAKEFLWNPLFQVVSVFIWEHGRFTEHISMFKSIYLFMVVCVGMCSPEVVDIREKLAGVCSLLPCEPWEVNSGPQLVASPFSYWAISPSRNHSFSLTRHYLTFPVILKPNIYPLKLLYKWRLEPFLEVTDAVIHPVCLLQT